MAVGLHHFWHLPILYFWCYVVFWLGARILGWCLYLQDWSWWRISVFLLGISISL